MNRASRAALAIVGVALLLAGCADQARFAPGASSIGMQMRQVAGDPIADVSDRPVADSGQGAVDTVSAETVEQQRQEVYDSLGNVQVELAEDYVRHAAEQDTSGPGADLAKEEFAPWGDLSPDEVAVLPAEYQYFIPAIGCDQLNSRTVVSQTSADDMFTACAPDPTESGSYLKYLMHQVRVNSDHVASAEIQPDQASGGKWVVAVEFTSAGTDEWSTLAVEATDQRVAILVDNTLVSAPTVQAGAETSGNVHISGDFSKARALDLSWRIGGP